MLQTPIKLHPFPPHTSTHPPPLLITQHPLTNLLPIQSPQSTVFLTQYSIHHLEQIPLFNIHFLPLTNLT
ncbi:hypothetical protein, partial [Cytobacillus oceanisediminis]|uniref:hypothetical protein n=1 Tax=Cytobacillus oceanisediminis TaxID=665099 RepID=UPI0037BF6FFD